MFIVKAVYWPTLLIK